MQHHRFIHFIRLRLALEQAIQGFEDSEEDRFLLARLFLSRDILDGVLFKMRERG